MTPLDLLWWSLAIFVASIPLAGAIVIIGAGIAESRKHVRK